MFLPKILIITVFVCTSWQIDYDFSNLEVVSDLTPEICYGRELNYALQSADGLPQCTAFPKPRVNPKKCSEFNNPGLKKPIQSLPKCDKEDTYAAVQCKGQRTTGRCFCFNSAGDRIFGDEWWTDAANMTCACSRKKDDMKTTSPKSLYFNSLHCNSRGNYEALQCDVVSEQCWCAEEMTGELTSPVVPQKAMTKLPCYSSIALGTQYLRPCESQNYARRRIEYELTLHGTTLARYPELLCGDDGGFGPYSVDGGLAYCVWKDNTKLGAWSTGEISPDIDCNCARDSRIYKDAGKTQTQKCAPNGNYQSLQTTGTTNYCIDKDGYKKSATGDKINLDTDCDGALAYH